MRVRTPVLFVVAACLGLTRPSPAIDGTEVIAPNPKAEARGGADVAVGDSALSQIENPATLTLIPRGTQAFDISVPLAFLVGRWRGPLDATDSSMKFVPVAQMGYAVPIDDRLTLGGAFHSRAGLGSSYNFRHILIPWMQRRVGSDMRAVDLEFNAGYKLTKKLSVGVGARFDVTTTDFSTVLGPADVDFGRGYAYGGGYSLGLHYQMRDDLSFGLAYHSPSWLSSLSGGHGQASLFGVLPVPLGRVGIEAFELPQKIAGGVAWDATRWLKLVGEVRWLNYSDSFFDEFTVTTDVLNVHYPLPLGYRDQWAFMGGAEFKLSEHWRLGVGYHYATQAVPAGNLLPQGDAITSHHMMAGIRYEQDKWWAGVGYIVGFPEKMHGTGWSNIPLGFDYGVSEIVQSQHVICTGFGFRW